mmetsp:Transcript_51818/g.62437  ORF Transcript_51818/g.62437 Transcript_51818/m.62437 type:complete len:110 (+) Transcript_51818:246-575(+)
MRDPATQSPPSQRLSPVLLGVAKILVVRVTNGFETGWAKRIGSYFREESPTVPAQTAPASIVMKEAVEGSDTSIEKSTLPQSSRVLNAIGEILMARGVCSVWGETIAYR